MKWNKCAREGIVVVVGQGQRSDLTHLSSSRGLFIDTLGTLYVADHANHGIFL